MNNDASTKAYKCKIVQEITSLYEESRRRNHYNEKKKNPVIDNPGSVQIVNTYPIPNRIMK